MLYFLFILIFFSNEIISDKDFKLNVEKSIKDEFNTKIPFRTEEFTYDSKGFLRIHGNWTDEKPRPVNLFFEEIPVVGCKDESRLNGLYFDMIFCLMTDTSCSKGMTICYEPELTAEKVNNSEKHEIKKVNKNVNCKNESLHGIHISAELNKTTKDFTIISSIDENNYTFSIPLKRRCFKIRIGTKDSIATMITFLNDKEIVVTPPLKTINKGRKWIDEGWAQNKSNFHLLSLDFIPRKDMRFVGTGDYYKKFNYFGWSNNCGLYMKITGEHVHRCRKNWTPVWEGYCTFAPDIGIQTCFFSALVYYIYIYYHLGICKEKILYIYISMVMNIHEYCMLHKYYFKKDESEPYILCIYRFQGIPANNNRNHLVGHVVEEQWMNKDCTSSEMLQEAGLIDSEFSNVVFIWFKDYLPHVPWRRVNVNLLDEQSDEEITIE